jgi:hypothetical protein
MLKVEHNLFKIYCELSKAEEHLSRLDVNVARRQLAPVYRFGQVFCKIMLFQYEVWHVKAALVPHHGSFTKHASGTGCSSPSTCGSADILRHCRKKDVR